MIDTKVESLANIYTAFSSKARPYKEKAACRKGCAYCCTNAGSIHITTLEGLAIRYVLNRLPATQNKRVRKLLAKDMNRRQKDQPSECPFLMKNKACMIYDHRPFICRRIYSHKTCSPNQPPVLHRQVIKMGDETICQLQRLDDTGYSGHLSYVLHMLDTPQFLKTYRNGQFKPEAIMDFGKTHKVLINRMACEP